VHQKCQIQDCQKKTGCQYLGYFYYSENLNWATQNLRLGCGLDTADLQNVWSTSRNMTGFLMIGFEKCCGSMVLTAVCYWPTHSIPAQKFVSVSAELNPNLSQWVLDADKGVRHHYSSPLELDR